MRRALPLLTALGVAVSGALIGWQLTHGFQAFTWESYRRIEVAQAPRNIPDVPLQTHTGQPWRLAESAGRLRLINFIYTRCPTLCRTSGSRYARLLQAIEQRGWDDRLQLISLSLQPGYDTPPRLRDYRQRYHAADDGLWLTARTRREADQRRLLDSYGVVSIPDPWGGIQHNDAIHVVDAAGNLIRILDATGVKSILAQLETLVENHVALASR